MTWDPRNRPEYVEIGHNGIREQYKGRGYGRLQLEEALCRIREYEGLKRIIVCTNSNLIAPKNYESAGFVLYDRKPNLTESAFAGIISTMKSCCKTTRRGINDFEQTDTGSERTAEKRRI